MSRKETNDCGNAVGNVMMTSPCLVAALSGIDVVVVAVVVAVAAMLVGVGNVANVGVARVGGGWRTSVKFHLVVVVVGIGDGSVLGMRSHGWLVGWLVS